MDIKTLFEKFNHLTILVIGDVMIDSYVWGKVERISPEAPVPVVHVQKREQRLGGAANVALNIQSLGAKPILCSVIGKDDAGNSFINILAKNTISSTGIILDSSRTTTVKERIIGGAQQLLRIDSEMDYEIDDQQQQNLIKKIDELLIGIDAIVFEDYDKGVLTPFVIQSIISKALAKKIPTIVDPKKRNFLNYHKATLFKPNLKEIKEGLKVDINPDNLKSIQHAVSQLKNELHVEGVLLTLSERGVFIDYEQEKHLIAAHKREITDVSGAGDTVTALAALLLALRIPAHRMAALVNLGGGLVCQHIGVIPIEKEELLQEAIKHNI